MPDLIGHSLGRYHILEQLGEGGMAIVYKAYDTRLEREVAIKIIRTERLTLETMPKALKRFEREAKSLGKLTHPNIVPVSDYGEYEGKPYLVMPYLPGGTLKSKLSGKPMPWQDAVRILLPIADALGYAHKHDVIHRDVKPANVLITENGQPMLSDFGVAKILDVEETMELTGTGVGIGTPEYMAPEQGSSKVIDHRADIYALGVVFYEMVTGRKPFIADTPLAVLIKRASEPLPRPKQFTPDLPQAVENVIIKSLAKRPEDRYQSMAEFAKALEGLGDAKAAGKRFITPKAKELREKRAEFKLPAIPRRTVITVGLIALGIGLVAIFSSSLKSLPAALFPTAASSNTPTPLFTATATPLLDEITDAKGVSMRLVPAGEFMMGSSIGGDANKQPVHTVYLDAYYMDKYEVTNALYEDCVNAGGCNAPKSTSSSTRPDYYGNPEFGNYPVVYVDWDMAKAYCKWRGADLPTESQWEKAARGTDNRTYPWGNVLPNFKLLNYHGNIGDTTKIGAYSAGVSPNGVYDMAGNAHEWVNDWYSYTYYQNSPSSNPTGPDSGTFRVLRGGSWATSKEGYVQSANRDGSEPANSNSVTGFRCAQSANKIVTAGQSSSLAAQTPAIPTETKVSETQTSSLGVGSTFTRAMDGMTMLYVPKGEFIMGSRTGSADEQPVHTVYLDSYWMDRTEVTNAMYKLCVKAGVCSEPSSDRGETVPSDYYASAQYDDYPVLQHDWEMAKTYCEWAGGRLPTESEWEKAARGTNQRIYPWGEGIDCSHANYVGDRSNKGCLGGFPGKVGSYESGKSPYGLYDMAGNAWEWVVDPYDSAYYTNSPANNPTGPTIGKSHVVRGGGALSPGYEVTVSNRDRLQPNLLGGIGIRCAASASDVNTIISMPSITVTPTP